GELDGEQHNSERKWGPHGRARNHGNGAPDEQQTEQATRRRERPAQDPSAGRRSSLRGHGPTMTRSSTADDRAWARCDYPQGKAKLTVRSDTLPVRGRPRGRVGRVLERATR